MPARAKAAPLSMPDRIIAAAYRCFDRYGVAKTSIEDIAAEASVTRATIYNHVGTKDALIARITEAEILKVNAEVRSLFVRKRSFEDTLTDCLLLVVRSASDNTWLRGILQSTEYLSAAADPASEAHRKQRQWWASLLNDAMHSGELAKDLSMDEVVSWLTLGEQMLLIKTDAVKLDDASLRRFIRRMIVLPLLARSATARPRRR